MASNNFYIFSPYHILVTVDCTFLYNATEENFRGVKIQGENAKVDSWAREHFKSENTLRLNGNNGNA